MPDQAVTLVFEDDIDASRGDVVCAADAAADVCDQLDARLVWMDERELVPGRSYQFRLGTRSASARVAELAFTIDVDTGEQCEASTLHVNEIGHVTLALDRPVAFDPYVANRDMGGCILIDRATRSTVAAGMVTRAVRRATNVRWQSLEVTKAAHAALNGHQPRVLWMTGRPRRRQDDDRQPARAPAARRGRAHERARRRQRAPRPRPATSGSATPTGSRTTAVWARSRS